MRTFSFSGRTGAQPVQQTRRPNIKSKRIEIRKCSLRCTTMLISALLLSVCLLTGAIEIYSPSAASSAAGDSFCVFPVNDIYTSSVISLMVIGAFIA